MRVRGPDLPDERAASSATVEKPGDEARRTAPRSRFSGVRPDIGGRATGWTQERRVGEDRADGPPDFA